MRKKLICLLAKMRRSIPLSHLCDKYVAGGSSWFAKLSIKNGNRGKQLPGNPWRLQEVTALGQKIVLQRTLCNKVNKHISLKL